MKRCIRSAALWAAAALWASVAVAQKVDSAVPPPPVADFYRVPTMFHPVPSPDGRFVAVAIAGPGNRNRLAVINLENLAESKVVAAFDDADIDGYAWVNDRRLVYSVGDNQSATRWIVPGLWAVNRDGGDGRPLIRAEFLFFENNVPTGKDRRLSWEWRLFDTLRDGSDDVIVRAPVFDANWNIIDTKLSRLDTRSGMTRALTQNAPAQAARWVLDRDGAPAAMTTWDRGRYASYLREGTGWKLWQEGDGYTQSFAVPYWVGPQGRLWVQARGKSDTEALYEVDPATRQLAERPAVDLPGYDFVGEPIYDRGTDRVLGYHYETDARGTVWIDPAMKALQAEVDKLLPATANRIDCERCRTVPTVLVTASSDRQPPAFYVYQRDRKELQPLGAARPWIKPAQMGLRDAFRFEARDGLQIPVLVTQPPGKASAPRPAVVLVHGGPWERGNHWEWERDAQFLASRGYVVIEPEFRGSTGYGNKLYRAGWKQWGLAMQDDVADATRWAIQKGLADPKRVCIAGASYGGYATLMGLIKNPELYQCGFEWVGVSDITLMYSIQWSDMSDDWKRMGMPVLVGDREKDAQQLKDTSPVEQAARLTRPLLMAYGGEDRRVPLKHGTAMRDALLASGNKSVEWLVYPNEGHGWHELANHVDFWTRVEKFLDRHIGAGAAR